MGKYTARQWHHIRPAIFCEWINNEWPKWYYLSSDYSNKNIILDKYGGGTNKDFWACLAPSKARTKHQKKTPKYIISLATGQVFMKVILWLIVIKYFKRNYAFMNSLVKAYFHFW